MRAIAIDRFGGPGELRLQTVPIPEVDPHEVLVRLDVADVGEWDPFEREGGYAEMMGLTPDFPYVLGSGGSGQVVAVGDAVEPDGVRLGDQVFASGFLNPKGGFYADYAAVDAEMVAPIPAGLHPEQAAVFGGVALTALRGLDDTLELKPGESVVVVGASGGVGHMAVQLARRMDARVLAVASGPDGVDLVERLGADAVVDGRTGASALDAALADFAPDGADAVLLTTGGEVADRAIAALRDGGRVAYPTGVQPEPEERDGLDLRIYNGEPDPELIGRLLRLIELPDHPPFHVEVFRVFPLDGAAEAHHALAEHHLGKLALRIR
jgi:NADPH:quinone reductase-like Zn-dependent oxidoreductase